ncbi:MAG: glycosyltransferase family 2 protein [Candidatus Bathyarchaeota archaeon]|nr:glycosyltransferase family 2 protein [Candidatus Bathyarchaeota archaeon]
MVGNVDIVMWTKNGAAYLPTVLAQIDRVIPRERICHKIMVDDHSTDGTPEIAKRFGWTVYPNPKSGISSGANEALSHVDQEFFVSVEQDVVLTREWWTKISKHLDDPNVACAQGIRIPTNPVLRLLDQWQYGDPAKRSLLVSMDNNLFRTKVVRSVGGFPDICKLCTDTVLMKFIQTKTPYRWVIDTEVVSDHIRSNFRGAVEHEYKLNELCSRTPYCPTRKPDNNLLKLFRILITSPIRALQIAIKKNCPKVIYAYPLIRYYHISSEINWRKQASKKN